MANYQQQPGESEWRFRARCLADALLDYGCMSPEEKAAHNYLLADLDGQLDKLTTCADDSDPELSRAMPLFRAVYTKLSKGQEPTNSELCALAETSDSLTWEAYRVHRGAGRP
jgi:hypothetical protein